MSDFPYQLDVPFDNATLKVHSVRGAAATFIAQALKFAVRLVSIVLLARLLSPADFGLVAMVAPIIALAQTLNDMGLAQAIVQREKISAGQVSGLFWLSFVIGLILAVILIALSPVVSSIYKEPATGHILTALAALVVVGTLSLVPTALLSRRMRFVSLAIIDIISTVAGIVVAVVAAWLGRGYWSLVYGQVATSILNLILVLAVSRWRPMRPQRGSDLRPLARFGLGLTGANLATYLMVSADNMIVGAVIGKNGLGIYDRSYALVVQPLGQIMAPVSRVAVPLLSRLIEDPELYRKTLINMLKICGLLTIPGMLVAIIFAKSIIHYVLGPAWAAAAPVFAWLCVGGLATPFFSAAGWIFVSHGRSRSQLIATVVVAAISVSSFALGVIWGIYGVAVVSAISFVCVQTPVMVWSSARTGHVNLVQFMSALALLLPAGALSGGVLLLLPKDASLAGLVGVTTVAYATFAMTLYVLPGGRTFFDTVIRMRSALRSTGV